ACVQLLTGEFPDNCRDVNNLWNWRKYPHISEHLGKILERMLREEPYYRYQSATEVIEAMNSLKQEPIHSKKINNIDDGKTVLIPIKVVIPPLVKGLLITAITLTTAGFSIAIYQNQIKNQNQNSSEKLFQDQQFGIEIKYPQNWQAEKQQYSPLTGGTIAKISPKSSSSNLDVGLFIRVIDIEKSQTLPNYNQVAIQEIKKSVIAVQILQQQSKNLDNREGYQIVYTGQDPINNNLRFKVIEVWTISNSKVYILTYRAEETLYDNFFKDVEQIMIRSFRFQSSVVL
ncbi:MAG: PsbP-related protein, partial [Dolichospermum sp.]